MSSEIKEILDRDIEKYIPNIWERAEEKNPLIIEFAQIDLMVAKIVTRSAFKAQLFLILAIEQHGQDSPQLMNH